MGEAVSFSRFVGIEITENNNLLKTLDALGMKEKDVVKTLLEILND